MTQMQNEQNYTQEAAENSSGQVAFEAKIVKYNPERGVIATADVKVGNILTVRNVRIREDDYGLKIVMPQTKMPHTGDLKDSVFFTEKWMKESFDQTVVKAYQESIQTLFSTEDEQVLENEMDMEM